MITIFRLTLANMRQKKFRTVLIILSIILSVALMYTVMSLSNQTTDIFKQKIKKEVGNAQLMVLPKENSGEQYIEELNFEQVPGMEYQIPLVTAYGYTEIKDEMFPVVFTGMSSEDYRTIYGLDFIEQNKESVTKDQAVIGKETADVYGLSLGDQLKISINNQEYSFTVSGIIEDGNNSLGYDLGNLELLVTKETLTDLLHLEHKVNGYYIKADESITVTDLKTNLENSFAELQIRNVTDMSDYKQMMQIIVTSLFLMVSAVVIVSAFIIYSSFKIISIERMPLMGTLRSIGATRNMTVLTLLLEAALYGITGGLLGNGLGIVILSATMKMMFQTYEVSLENISYIHINYMIIALLIGLVLSLVSAMIPIRSISKRSIRSIIFAEVQNEKHTSFVKTILGVVLIIIAFILFRIAPVELKLLLTMMGMLLVTIGGAMIIPILSRILTKILGFLLRPIYKEQLDIVTANLNNDRTMMNNIMLLAMGLGVILMINNFSTTVSEAVTNVYGTGRSDALAFYDLEDSFVEQVKKVEGVEHVYTNKQVYNLTANHGKVKLMSICGIDGHGYSEYAWDEFGTYMKEDLMKQFRSERSALLTKFIAKKYDLKTGDTLEIDFNGKIIPYKVIGIVPSIMNNGNVTYVYEDFLVQDSGVKNSQSMYLNIDDSYDTKEVIQDIKELLPYGILPIQTLQDMQDQNMKQNNAIFMLMKAVSIIAMFIGVVGILNNFTISFLSRKKLMATMRSLGLSKRSTMLHLLLEAFICGLLGTISGLLLGTILIEAMKYVVEAMGIPSDVMFFSSKDYIFVLLSGIVLSIASAILPAVSISKENIITGLRYE